MQGLKKNSLSAWLMHPKNKVMDASLGSSGNADKRDNSVELTSGAYDDAIYESISPSKLTTASSEVLSNANTALTELTAASSARFQMANTTLTELAAGKPTADGPTTEICDQSKVKKVTYAESCNESSDLCNMRSIDESIIEQLSKISDVDEDIDFLNPQYSKIKRIVYLIISSFTFRIFAILLIFLDMAFIIKDVIFLSGTTHISLESRSISFAIALFFFMDVSLRVFIEGLRIVLRPVRLVILIRVFHLAHQKRHLEMLTRRMVSGNKRRYKKDGFDLDLTYVTERIIAMSFPSSGKQSFYRNPIKEVVRFLDTKHPNHYQVYNLCSERAYDPKYFHHRVHRYLIDDHNVPSLSEMLAFSMEVKEWMAQDKDNIIVVHCKGGKGRTGTMVCAYLLASEIFATAEDSLYYFGERRTDKSTSSKFQGIETPSQNRFVGYFAMVKNIYNLTLPPIKKLTIKKIVIYSIHGVGKGNGHDLKVQIIMQRKTVFFCSASKNCRIFHDAETDRVILLLSKCPPLYDEVKVKFFSSSALPKYYENCAFFFWFHMSFIRNNRLYLSRSELDNPHKIKAWKAYSPQFAVEVYFDDI
ncbi:phosphatidylinositol 3,4,5-trisphosphate 3-phosphatase TPTE2-like isoform X6 [Bubalus kerabau]|uniref:phosphatidylinositol 3,4,5-trisphosphate 3-phosphatase TPTE2 isoform X7 n=1 Tax=Bubalus bubalis TaxID=89462 RepID=UPI001E1B9C25|nr:phosphatidylinositol 3,4,5-trisphosphate 3-phosphatase TPTE2 isoform X7 [Bubalus bubalis]XP_055398230.1 phosphatidylinositol 3,4,5-trisphosphate 3-phosphatase TPTE2-like isoform X6 [Bubalus carabanensis]